MESCEYLLTANIEMDPLPGFESSGWDQGYGDYRMVPDRGTLRRLSWPPSTALVIADLQKKDESDVTQSPRAVLRKQCGRAESLGFAPMMASELEFYLFRNSYEDIASGDSARPTTTHRIDYQILGTQEVVLGQFSFITTIVTLVVIARLRKFDRTLEEAAQNLGANRFEVIWYITLKYLRPAIVGGFAVAFLMSFENFNTSVFLVGSRATLPINLYAGKSRAKKQ